MKINSQITRKELRKYIVYTIIINILLLFVLGFENDLALSLSIALFTFIIIPGIIQCIDITPFLKCIITTILFTLGVCGYILGGESIKTITNYVIVLLIIVVLSILKYNYDH